MTRWQPGYPMCAVPYQFKGMVRLKGGFRWIFLGYATDLDFDFTIEVDSLVTDISIDMVEEILIEVRCFNGSSGFVY